MKFYNENYTENYIECIQKIGTSVKTLYEGDNFDILL